MTTPFGYARAADEPEALRLAAAPGAIFLAGGTDFVPLWKAGVSAPSSVVDIAGLPLDGIDVRDDSLVIGALVRLADAIRHPVIQRELPALGEALRASASPQVRNMATVGGNLMQRTRCLYFRGSSYACNKRAPGSGCSAIEGENRQHAILGASDACIATHPSDLAVALVALGASLHLHGQVGERHVAVEDFYLLPSDTPERETVLLPGELIVAIKVPRHATRWRSAYFKLRDRASFEFAVVSAAVAAELDNGRVKTIRLAAGGVATTPWRLRACEAALTGALLDDDTSRRASALAVEGARPLAGNGFKAELLRRTVHRLLTDVLLGDNR